MVGKQKEVPNKTTKKRRICTGSEIITSKESLEKLKEKELEKEKKGTKSQKNTGKENKSNKRNGQPLNKGRPKKQKKISESSEDDEEIGKLTVDTSDDNVSEESYYPSKEAHRLTEESFMKNTQDAIELNEKEDESEDEDNMPLSKVAGQLQRVISWEQINEDVFLLVSFPSVKKDKYYKYVCVVKSRDGDDIEVVGLRSLNSNNNEFIILSTDVSFISIDMIIEVLPTPKTVFRDRLIIYQFPLKPSVYEK